MIRSGRAGQSDARFLVGCWVLLLLPALTCECGGESRVLLFERRQTE